MLIVFPLGLLAMSFVFDLIGIAAKASVWGLVAYWNIAAGLVSGLIAGGFGLVDLLAIPSGTRAARVGIFHALLNVVVLGFFAVSFAMRTMTTAPLPNGLMIAVSGVGLALALVSGWLGGELVEQLGVGVDDHASLDAPSSLRRRR